MELSSRKEAYDVYGGGQQSFTLKAAYFLEIL